MKTIKVLSVKELKKQIVRAIKDGNHQTIAQTLEDRIMATYAIELDKTAQQLRYTKEDYSGKYYFGVSLKGKQDVKPHAKKPNLRAVK